MFDARRRRNFERSGQLALIPLSLYLLVWIPLNVRIGGPWWDSANIVDISLVVVGAVDFVWRKRSIREMATVAYLALVIIGMLFVWSRPGVS